LYFSRIPLEFVYGKNPLSLHLSTHFAINRSSNFGVLVRPGDILHASSVEKMILLGIAVVE
jgi:hypothetical protein